MNIRLRAPVATAVAIGVGIIVLLGYVLGGDAGTGYNFLGLLRVYFLEAGVVLAAVAVLVGIVNLLGVHINKIRLGESDFYSFVLILAFLITVALGLYDFFRVFWLGDVALQRTMWIFENVQFPIETSLMAVLTLSLTVALYRLSRRKLSVMSSVFIVTVFLLLLASIPLVVNSLGIFADLYAWLTQVVAVSGARGILIGVGLGIVAAGIRVLIGYDRPYGGG